MNTEIYCGSTDSKKPSMLTNVEDELLFVVLSIDNCPPCNVLSKAIDILKKEYPNVNFECLSKGDNECLDEYAGHGKFGLTAFPNIFISNSEIILKAIGASKSVSTEVDLYSTVIEAFRSGEIELDKDEGKALIDDEIEFSMERIK